MKILTFDIEDWFHILDNDSTKNVQDWNKYSPRIFQNMETIFNFLKKNNLKATFFCLGWIAKKYPEIIRRIDELGCEVATHSNHHQLVYEMSKSDFKEDLKKSIYSLEDLIGKKIKSYRAPGFSITKNSLWAFEILYEFGIETDCSVFPASRSHGGISNFGIAEPCKIRYNGIELKEFPLNTGKVFGKEVVFSGGGYFRLMPYNMIKKMTVNSEYIMTYFHPRDFDPHQPMIQGLSKVRKFKSYVGLKKAESKLERWISEFEFEDIECADTKIDWGTVPVIDLKNI